MIDHPVRVNYYLINKDQEGHTFAQISEKSHAYKSLHEASLNRGSDHHAIVCITIEILEHIGSSDCGAV